MRLAIFDVDGTLVAGKSTEKRFIGWMLRRGIIGPRQLLSAAWFVVRWFPRYGRHVFRKNKAYLNGLTEDLIEREVERFGQEISDEDWIQPALAELRRHQESGDVVILLSGSLQPIVEYLRKRFAAEMGLGTHCETVQGRYTAVPPARHPFYEDKSDMLISICKRYDVAANEVSAYADSGFDIPLLASVGDPVAVRPDRRLAEWAKANNCRIIEKEQ
ncbi:MAG: HAD family hydrolase [Woeseiaceae bacterium]